MAVSGMVIECSRPLLLRCAASAAKEGGRIAVIRADGLVEFYEVIGKDNKVCIRKLGLGNEYLIGKGDVVVAVAWIDGEYWHELQKRGVVALVKPPPSVATYFSS